MFNWNAFIILPYVDDGRVPMEIVHDMARSISELMKWALQQRFIGPFLLQKNPQETSVLNDVRMSMSARCLVHYFGGSRRWSRKKHSGSTSYYKVEQ